MGFTFFVLVAWFYWSGLELGLPARLHAHLHRMQPGYEPGFKSLPFFLGALYTLAWLAALGALRRSPERPLYTWAAGISTVWALLAILFVGYINTGKSYRSMVLALEQALPPKHRCISSRELGESQRAMLHYYAGLITYRDEVETRRRPELFPARRQGRALPAVSTHREALIPSGPGSTTSRGAA